MCPGSVPVLALSKSFPRDDTAWTSWCSLSDALADGLLVNRAVYI